MTTPHLEYAQLWPVILVLGAACVGILVEAFVPRAQRLNAQIVLTGATLLVALGGTVGVATTHLKVDAEGALAVDGPALYLQGLILVVAVGGLLLFAERRLESGVTAFAGQAAALPGTGAEREASARGLEHSEVYPLLLFAVGGMLLFPAANDLLLLFVALEVLSLPLYLLCALARRRRLLSQEAALKYFLLGAFSSAFLLYGIALLYGYAGSMRFSDIAAVQASGSGDHNLLLLGIGMLSVGLFFKVGAVPFHAWTPDVYQGAPTPVTSFMSAATKIAAFGAILRLFTVAFQADDLKPMLWTVTIATMVVGTMVAVVQTDVKRMLAYSSIAHTGFLLTGVIGIHRGSDVGLRAVLLYLTAYAASIVGSFALVALVRDPAGEVTSFRGWAGLGRRAPLLSGLFTLFLLSMAGIPLTAGFLGKWAVFEAALDVGAWPVVVVAILTSIVAVFFYVRFVRLLYFTEPDDGTATVATPSLLTQTVIGACALATIVVGVIPGPVLNLIGDAGSFLR